MLRFVLTRDAEQFALRVERFLSEQPERNVLATVLIHARDAGHSAAPPLFAYGLQAGEVRAAALRTPPWPLLASEMDADTAACLIEQWIEEDPAVPGISAAATTARAGAGAWARCTGGETRCRMSEAMHVLSAVSDPPRPARGALRPAGSRDRRLLIAWEQEFVAEAGLRAPPDVERLVDARLARGAQLVWDDGGACCTLALSPEVAGTVRIGPVYTPPAYRRRGYASSAVAEVSRRVLSAGARQCMLFTDLANPTSNKIYASVGFRRIGDWEEHDFLPR